MKSRPPPPPRPSFSRDALSDVFLRVAAQLEALQLPPKATDDAARFVPSHDRIAEILRTNARFRPADDVQRQRTRVTSDATQPLNTAVAPMSPPRRESTPVASAPTPPLFVPVGGRARVIPSADLARVRRSLQKRSRALANLHATVAAGSFLEAAAPSTLSGKQALISELVQRTSFSTQHIFHMSRKFKEMAGPTKSVISFPEFRALLSDDVGALLLAIGVDVDDGAFQQLAHGDLRAISATISASESFLRRLFATFDGDGDGKIDFREFVLGLNGFVKGSLADKVDALFDAYAPPANDDHAPTKDRTVAISDLLGLFQGDRQLYQELMRCIDEYFARMELRDDASGADDAGDDNILSCDDFVAASVAELRLLETITRPTPSLAFSEDAHLRERLKAFVDRRALTWPSMVELQRRVQASSASRADLRLPSASVLHLLLTEPDESDELNHVVRAYLTKQDASPPLVDVAALLQDLTVVLLHPTTTTTSDTDAKARYYFDRFDTDGDGRLARHELVSGVCAGFAHFGPSLTDVVRVLEDEDTDQDGELTKAQYLRAARRSPLILASLYTCL